MKSKNHPLLLAALFGLLLAAAALLAGQTAQAARPAGGESPDTPAGGIQGVTDGITVTVLTLNISNEAPGHLIDALIAEGHGNQTLFEVLGYLKAQSGSVISDTFYQDVANAPAGSGVFTARLNNYAGLNASVEISADGTVHIRGLDGSAYTERPGYETVSSQDAQFTLTYAQDADHYIYTGSEFSHGTRYDYYAFAIAWREGHTVFLPAVARGWPAP